MRYGLGAVKGTGQGAVEEILRSRQADGPFANLFDFCRRINKHAVNRLPIEALIKAGAFDTIEPNRPAMLARSAAPTSELQSLIRISYAAFCFQYKRS